LLANDEYLCLSHRKQQFDSLIGRQLPFWARGVAQAVECKSEALSSNPSPTKKKAKRFFRINVLYDSNGSKMGIKATPDYPG
jgi:hypothetical protein